MERSDKPVTTRVLSIDIVRGFALVCMVLVHFLIYFSNAEAEKTWLYFSFNHLLGDWGASCFLMMMGISQVFSERKHTDLSQYLLFQRALIRGLFIFIAGIVMLVLAWGPSQIWRWDILTLMGFATIIIFFCRKLPSWSILFLALLIALVSPYLRGQLAF